MLFVVEEPRSCPHVGRCTRAAVGLAEAHHRRAVHAVHAPTTAGFLSFGRCETRNPLPNPFVADFVYTFVPCCVWHLLGQQGKEPDPQAALGMVLGRERSPEGAGERELRVTLSLLIRAPRAAGNFRTGQRASPYVVTVAGRNTWWCYPRARGYPDQ